MYVTQILYFQSYWDCSNPETTSMLGGMRITAGKSALFFPEPDITSIDGCAFLWIIYWPGNGTVQRLCVQYNQLHINESDKKTICT